MTVGKEIRTKIRSVQSTQKITRAMEMVAVSKKKKAEQRMRASKPYADRIKDVIDHVVAGQLEYSHSYLVERPVKNVGVLLVSSDRGLCGSLNTYLFKEVMAAMHKWEQAELGVKVCPLGRKAEVFFSRYGAQIIASVSQLGDTPSLRLILGGIAVMLEQYKSGALDQVYIASNQFINTMVQEPQLELLLPIKARQTVSLSQYPWDYIYEPKGPEILDVLLNRYIESIVYQAVVENIACEQAARMVAMKNASENANQLIDDLKLRYNKARQAAITQEIAEIVGGAAAV